MCHSDCACTERIIEHCVYCAFSYIRAILTVGDVVVQLTGWQPFGVAAAHSEPTFCSNSADSQAELHAVMEQHASWVNYLHSLAFGLLASKSLEDTYVSVMLEHC